MSNRARHTACHVIAAWLWPRAARLAIEKGSATPTRNENDGWMRSCSEQPTHSTWLWCQPRNCQNAFSGTARATRESRRTSAIIRNITKPRYASTDESRPGATGTAAILAVSVGEVAGAEVRLGFMRGLAKTDRFRNLEAASETVPASERVAATSVAASVSEWS